MAVPGFFLKLDAITVEEEKQLIELVNKEKWKDTPLRKNFHYGYNYDHSSKKLDTLTVTKAIPAEILALYLKCVNQIENVTDEMRVEPQAVVVNKYYTNQRLGQHIDNPALFGPVIGVVSLGSPTHIELKLNGKLVSYAVPGRSFYLMSDDSRYKWTHGVNNDKDNKKGVRYSIVFRTVNI